KAPLVVEPLAWTPGTNGTVTASAINIILPEGPLMPEVAGRGPGPAGPPQHFGPTREQLAAALDAVKDRVRGKIVLVGKAAFVPVSLGAPPGRISDEDAQRRYQPNALPRPVPQVPTPPPGALTTRQVDREVDEFLVANGAAARINDAARPHGQIIAFSNRTYDLTQALPTVVMRNEDYGRLSRIIADGTPVEIEMTIVNKTYAEGTTAYNAIAEIPGTDKKDEIVMLGGHLDSWHSATGATDNAIGCATTMEAARILKALGVKPRRTIRVALWSGEEQGLLGSLAYVSQHF